MNNFTDWEVGDRFFYIEYLENRCCNHSLGNFVVKMGYVHSMKPPHGIYMSGDEGIRGFHYSDIIASEQRALNVAADKNKLLEIAAGICL